MIFIDSHVLFSSHAINLSITVSKLIQSLLHSLNVNSHSNMHLFNRLVVNSLTVSKFSSPMLVKYKYLNLKIMSTIIQSKILPHKYNLRKLMNL